MSITKLVFFILIILSFNASLSNGSLLDYNITPLALTSDLTVNALTVKFNNTNDSESISTTLSIPINTPFAILVLHFGAITINKFMKVIISKANSDNHINPDIQLLVDFLKVCTITDRSWVSQKLLTGSGLGNKKYTYPRLDLLIKVFDMLSIVGYENITVADACYSLLINSSDNPGGLSENFSHMILTSIYPDMSESYPQLLLITQSVINNITIDKVETLSIKKTRSLKSNISFTAANNGTYPDNNKRRFSKSAGCSSAPQRGGVASYCSKVVSSGALLFTGINSCSSLPTDNQQYTKASTKVPQTKHNCSENEFPCWDNNECIPSSKVCNSDYDCNDHSDERMEGCNEHCVNDRFKCVGTSQCIKSEYVCDGLSDCRDNSDELPPFCPCDKDLFACDNKCLENSKLCNGIIDCEDNYDESIETCKAGIEKNIPKVLKHFCPETSSHINCISSIKRTCCDQANSQNNEYYASSIGIKYAKCIGMDLPKSADCQNYFDCGYDNEKIFSCPSLVNNKTTHCFRSRNFCDGEASCTNNADEDSFLCENKCRKHYFSCGDDQCIDKRKIGDGKYDCRNNIDENPYTITKYRFEKNIDVVCESHKDSNFEECKAAMREGCCSGVTNTFLNVTDKSSPNPNEYQANSTLSMQHHSSTPYKIAQTSTETNQINSTLNMQHNSSTPYKIAQTSTETNQINSTLSIQHNSSIPYQIAQTSTETSQINSTLNIQHNSTALFQRSKNFTKQNKDNKIPSIQKRLHILKSFVSTVAAPIIGGIGIAGFITAGAIYAYCKYKKKLPGFIHKPLGQCEVVNNADTTELTYSNSAYEPDRDSSY